MTIDMDQTEIVESPAPHEASEDSAPAIGGAPRPLIPQASGMEDHDGQTAAPTGTVSVRKLNAYYGEFRAIRDISLTIRPRAVTAIIGPSGCGKSTFLRTINRMHELTPN